MKNNGALKSSTWWLSCLTIQQGVRAFRPVTSNLSVEPTLRPSSTQFRHFHSNDNNDENTTVESDTNADLGSLDEVLQKARRRPTNMLVYRVRAFFNQPLLIIPQPLPSSITIGDTSLILIALWIGAKGFALGLLIGKLTSSPLRRILDLPASTVIILMPLWPVLWAIILDQYIQ